MIAKRQWPIPGGLILLAAVPIAAGAARVGQLAGGASATAENARFFASPVPVVLHIVGATLFCLVGALQFAPNLRRNRWHRLAGRVLLPCGLVAALSGLWMTLFYPRPPADDLLLEGFRLVFGIAMVFSLGGGFLAIRQHNYARHRAWMMRGYAIGIGAGTQALLFLPLSVLGISPEGTGRSLLMALAWVLNLAVAQWFIHNRPIGSGVSTARLAAMPLADHGVAR